MSRFSLNLQVPLGVACAVLSVCAASAQSPVATNTVIAFGYGQGILQAGDGNFYAISASVEVPCIPNVGECNQIAQITPAGVAGFYYSFEEANNNSPDNDGGCQLSDLIAGTDGYLYGTCIYGGLGGVGTIFKIPLNSSSPEPTTLASFEDIDNNPDPGYQPLALVVGKDGNIYFTNSVGVYKLDSSGVITAVYTFPVATATAVCTNGCYPTSIMQASDGNFYVTLAVAPGAVDGYSLSAGLGRQPGAIAQISPTGEYQLIHTLATDGSEGDTPSGPLVEDSTGALYGMTASSNNQYLETAGGVAFKVTTSGQYSVLYSFTGEADGMVDTDDFIPALILGSDGNLYGTTVAGGNTTSGNCAPFGCGTVFQLTTSGTLTTVYTFTGGVPLANTTTVAQNPQVNGSGPQAPLVQTTGGYFYGTQTSAKNLPVVFKISLTDPLPSPIQLTFDPAQVAPGNTTTINWSVLNAYSQTAQLCSASVVGNPTGAGTWTGVQTGSLSDGVYSGSATITPTAGGNFTYALTCGGQESGFATLAVNDDLPLQIDPPTPATLMATVNTNYNLALIARGGTGQYTWSITQGAVPPGLTFDQASGTFSGQPQQYGSYPLTVMVQDTTSPTPLQQSASFAITVASGLNLLNNLPNGIVGMVYQGSLVAGTTGGLPQYSWSLTSGKLPPGLQLIQNTGAITGTPTTKGSYPFTITVSDSENMQATFAQSFNIQISGVLAIATSSPLPNAAVGEPYSAPLNASGGTPPYNFSFVTNAGSVPPGLTITGTQTQWAISGTPTQWTTPAGSYNSFYVMVSDSSNPQLTSSSGIAIQVESTLQITLATEPDGTVSLPNGTVGVLTSFPLTASGGVPPYKWSVSSNSPANLGLTIVNGNVLEYDPAVAVSTVLTLTVSDSEQFPATAYVNGTLTVVPMQLPTTTTLTSSNSAAGTGESVTLTANVTQSGGGIPTGQVIFSYGPTTLGTLALNASGVATLQTSFAATGVYDVVASYGGSANYAPSVSSALTETVITPGVTAAVSPASLSVEPGSSGQLVITITPAGGYTGSIDFSCGTLPAHVSCTFAPASLAISGAGPFTDTLTVSTNATATAQLRKPGEGGRLDGLFLAALFWLPGSTMAMFGLVRRRKQRSTPRRGAFWIIAILLLIGAGALSGCGGPSSLASPGTYTIPITLTVSGQSTQNISASVIVE